MRWPQSQTGPPPPALLLGKGVPTGATSSGGRSVPTVWPSGLWGSVLAGRLVCCAVPGRSPGPREGTLQLSHRQPGSVRVQPRTPPHRSWQRGSTWALRPESQDGRGRAHHSHHGRHRSQPSQPCALLRTRGVRRVRTSRLSLPRAREVPEQTLSAFPEMPPRGTQASSSSSTRSQGLTTPWSQGNGPNCTSPTPLRVEAEDSSPSRLCASPELVGAFDK